MKKSKIIAIDVRCLEWQRGGVARFLIKFIEKLPLLNKGQKFILYFQNQVPQDSIFDDNQFLCKVIPGPNFLKRRRILCEQILLPIQLIKDSVDILFCPWYTAPLLNFKAKIILGAWDISYITHPKHYRLIHRFSLGFIGRLSLIYCDKVITCSRYDADQIRFYLKNRNKNKNILTLNFPAEKKFAKEIKAKDVNKVLNAIGIKKPYILSLGVIYNRRNIPALIEAVEKLNIENLSLLIVGKNETYPKVSLSKLLQPLAKKGRIKYIKYLDESLLLPVYKGAFIYYCTSDVDGEAILLKEAMLAGTPIVSSKLLYDATNGFGIYVNDPSDSGDIASSISKAYETKDQLDHQTFAAKKWVNKISWDDAILQANKFTFLD